MGRILADLHRTSASDIIRRIGERLGVSESQALRGVLTRAREIATETEHWDLEELDELADLPIWTLLKGPEMFVGDPLAQIANLARYLHKGEQPFLTTGDTSEEERF